jgi:hypothetical protein
MSQPMYSRIFEQSELKFGFQAESCARVTFVFARRMLSQLSPSSILYVVQAGGRQRSWPASRPFSQNRSRLLTSSKSKVATLCEWETVVQLSLRTTTECRPEQTRGLPAELMGLVGVVGYGCGYGLGVVYLDQTALMLSCPNVRSAFWKSLRIARSTTARRQRAKLRRRLLIVAE